MELDLSRSSRSTRTKHVNYRDLSDSDSESAQSDYEKGEAIMRTADSSESDTDSEDKVISDVISATRESTTNYIGRRISKNFSGKDYIGFVIHGRCMH